MLWIGAGFFVTGEAACERTKECTYAYMTDVSEQPTKPGMKKTSQPERFGLYGQVTKRTWWMPRQ